MTKKKSSWPNSKITPKPQADAKSIGTELSTLGSDQGSQNQTSTNVVALTLNVSRDKEAKTCLPSRLASCLEPQFNSEWDTIRYDLTATIDVEVLKHGRSQILDLCEAPERSTVIEGLIKLRALTAHRNEENANLELISEAYIDKLMAYPADAVVQALNEAPDRDKWFPAWHDLKDRLDYLTTDRRLMVNCIDREIAKLDKTSVQGLIKGAITKCPR